MLFLKTTLILQPFSRKTQVIWYQNVGILIFAAAMDDGGNRKTGATRCAKPHANCHHQQTNKQTFYRLDTVPVQQTQNNHEIL